MVEKSAYTPKTLFAILAVVTHNSGFKHYLSRAGFKNRAILRLYKQVNKNVYKILNLTLFCAAKLSTSASTSCRGLRMSDLAHCYARSVTHVRTLAEVLKTHSI